MRKLAPKWLSKLLSDKKFDEILNSRPFFVIVHEYCVRGRRIKKRIERIKNEGQFAEIKANESSGAIPLSLPRGKKILVCGAYRDLCVTTQLKALLNAGYNAEICNEATYHYPC